MQPKIVKPQISIPENIPPTNVEIDWGILEDNISSFEYKYYETRPKIPSNMNKSEAYLLFRHNLEDNLKTFCNEYNLGYFTNNNNLNIRGELSPVHRKYILNVSRHLVKNSGNLKYFYTHQGKNAEAVFRLCVNHLFNFFRLKKRLEVSREVFAYGGDGGADFRLGSSLIDIKYRDDGPGAGLILDSAYLDKAHPDTTLVLVTNATSTKLGNLAISDVNTSSLPVALAGWISLKDFQAKKTLRGGSENRYVVDQLNDIVELLVKLVEDQIVGESLFKF